MARNGRDRLRGVASGFAKKVQTKLGLLALSGEQRTLDHVGFPRWSLCIDRFAVVPRCSECSGRNQISVN